MERKKTLLYFIYRKLYIRKKPSNETVHVRSQTSSKIVSSIFRPINGFACFLAPF